MAASRKGCSGGVGTELIQHALDWMREQGLAMAKIETLVQNERGQALYPRFGFQEVARQIHYVMPLAAGGSHHGVDDARAGHQERMKRYGLRPIFRAAFHAPAGRHRP